MGEVITHGQRQLSWDPWGRLTKITDSSSSWEASYDAFGRRLQTRHTKPGESTLVTNSFYDPNEEFQEIGLQVGGKTFWKIYGPDACDAISDETGASVALMHNALRQLTGVVSPQGTHYNEKLPSAYGPLESTLSVPSDLASYAQSLNWHSKAQDPTGFIWMGDRYYDARNGQFLSQDPLSYPICLDLYAYANGDPINYFDPSGRFASPVYQPLKATVLNVWNNPRFQGSLQAVAGFAEASAGAALAPTPFAPLGIAMLVHGADHFAVGGYAMATGRYRATATEHLFQKAGMSPEWASFINNVLSIGGFTGSISLARNFAYQSSRAMSQAAMSSFEISATSFEAGQNFKPFIKSYYRENLKIFTDTYPSKNIDAHHVFPQQFEESFFIKRRINIHEPQYLTWWEKIPHRTSANQYNQDWIRFMRKNPDATRAEILQKGKEMMTRYGIETNY